MAQYDAFADFYNRNWGQDYHAQIMSILGRLLLPELRSQDLILDVGCGNGRVAEQLLHRGFGVIGIDQSETMLGFARRNAPGARFAHADARAFTLDSKVKGTIATFEAMNHILEPEDLKRSFQCIADVTEHCFVFDMNRETAFEMFWNNRSTVEADGVTCELSSRYDPLTRIASCRTDVERQVTEITERYYDAEVVEAMVLDAGFSSVHRFDAKRDLGMWGSVSVGRFFYQCFR